MSLISIIQKTEVPCRLLLCNKRWTTHLIPSARKSFSPLGLLYTWDASHWADIPNKIRMLANSDYDDLTGMAHKSFLEKLREDQEFRQKRYNALGPDIAAATFIVARGGKVKFTNFTRWTTNSSGSAIAVPIKKTDDFFLEAIDASGMMLLPIALDNLMELDYMKYLNLSNVQFLSDWHLAKLGRFSSTLEFLDISNNEKITDEGLASLYRLRNLKCLNIEKCPGIKIPAVVCTYLMEFIPDLTIVGLDSSPAEKIGIFERECQELRFLNIGDQLDVSEEKQDKNNEPVKVGDSIKNENVEMFEVNREPLEKAASV